MKSNKEFRVFLSDVDGVMTDGGRYISENGDEMKKFHIPDGMGLYLLHKMGIKIGIITTEDNKIVEQRAEQLKVDFFCKGTTDKLAAVEKICRDAKISLSEIAYIGDDVNDYHLLRAVGLAACPANAQPIIKAIPGIRILKNSGGYGAVREWINELVGEEELVKAWSL